MKIIAISGKKHAGKDTVAHILRVNHKGPSLAYSFATPLKQEVAMACGVKVEFIEQFKDNFRLILQGWGTNFRRQLYDEYYWTKKMSKALDMFEGAGNIGLVVIPDMRFKNEYALMKARGATLVRVEREGLQADGHPSETDLDNEKFTHTIYNNGTLANLVAVTSQIKTQ